MADGGNFSTQSFKRVVFVNGERSLKDQDVNLSISTDGKTATVFVNGKSFTLTRNSGGSSGSASGFVGLYPLVDTNDHVRTFAFVEDSNPADWSSGYENNGSFTAGYRTDPAIIDGMTGSASRTGTIRAEMFIGALHGWGTGQIDLDFDFDAEVVSGTIHIADTDVLSGLRVPDIDITLNPSGTRNLDKGSFVSDPAMMQITIESVVGEENLVTDAGLSGQLYGPAAEAIGGTLWLEGTSDGLPMFLQGAFATQ